MNRERKIWNEKYAAGSHASMRPDPFLRQAFAEFVQPLFPHGGKALDVAGGRGRHAFYLATRGWQVTLVDVSDVAISAVQAARQRKIPIRTVLSDLETFDFHQFRKKFDLVLVFFYLQRTLFPALIETIRPGGLLLYETYTTEQRKFGVGPTHPSRLLRTNELLREFGALQILHYRETVRERGVAELVGRKK